MSRSSIPRAKRSPIAHATALVRALCKIDGVASMVTEAREHLEETGVIAAIQFRDSAVLYDWFMNILSYQGISDTVAFNYMERPGRISTSDVERALARKPSCPKLIGYWHFLNCGYRKGNHTCSEPDHLKRCPLPRPNLRNGRLNQIAYSLYLFSRDRCGGDMVGWIDRQLAEADRPGPRRGARMASAVIEPLRDVYGVSDKVLSLSFAMLLLAGDPERERWRTAGAAMIAIDTLVHNWLHRTGILRRFDAEHSYGAKCYAEKGCASIIFAIAQRIDARTVDPSFPKSFNRLIQYAIWRFCSEAGLSQCNGNRVDDRHRCKLKYCLLHDRCDRRVLHAARPNALES